MALYIAGQDLFDNRRAVFHVALMSDADRISAYIGLGSNLGDAKANLAVAVAALGRLPGMILGKCSSVYFTEPQGRKDQPWFANQALELLCPALLKPHALLRELLSLEISLGRVRAPDIPPNSPRVIDLDLLLMGGITLVSPDLILPHPRLAERAFVLAPLLDIAPDLRLPDGRPLAAILNKLDYRVADGKIYQS